MGTATEASDPSQFPLCSSREDAGSQLEAIKACALVDAAEKRTKVLGGAKGRITHQNLDEKARLQMANSSKFARLAETMLQSTPPVCAIYVAAASHLGSLTFLPPLPKHTFLFHQSQF